MFTEIGIENFKAFGKMQRIPLKPITLLYGPNSSGKSSLMQALLMLKQTLEESGDKDITLLPKGNLVDVGNYQEFINRHDVKKDFRLSISFRYFAELGEFGGAPIQIEGEKDDLSLEFTFSRDKTDEVLLKSINLRESLYPNPLMVWKNVWTIPYLKRAILKKRAEFEQTEKLKDFDICIADLKKSILVLDHICLEHHFLELQWSWLGPIIQIGRGRVTSRPYANRNHAKHRETIDEIKKLQRYLTKELQEIEAESNKLNATDYDLADLAIRKAKFKQSKNILKLTKIIHRSLMRSSYKDILKICNYPASHRLIAISNCFADDKVALSGKETRLFQYIPEFASLGKPETDTSEIYEELNLANFFPWVSSLFKDYLRRIAYIGPLRECLERVYFSSGNSPSSVGKTGKNMPDILLKRPGLVNKVNEWFKRFEMGYVLHPPLPTSNDFKLTLRDEKADCPVSPKDVGFGVGQLFPILVQGLLSENKIILIEQPEIHVHPRLQAELGSFFAAVAGRTPSDSDFSDPLTLDYGNQLIIETHSENIILRLQKLIRKGELKKEDVAVIYCDKIPEGTVATELRLNDKGEFIDPWPHGFFEESFKEMFGD